MKLFLVILISMAAGVLFAHNETYQSKSYTFHREGHVIDVEIDHDNMLRVNMDTVEIGTRTNFCTPID